MNVFLAFLQIFSLLAHEEGRRMMLIKIKRVHRELQINEEGIFFEKKNKKSRVGDFGRENKKIIYLHTHITA